MKRILVTGGAGFLGSHLCDRLIEQGHQVFCLDNLQTGSKKNISHLEANPRFIFEHRDIRSPLRFDVDEIYNLACPASPVHYQKDPISTVETCVTGVMNVLEVARRNKAKVFQASTSEVYGDPTEHPQKESYLGNVNPNGIRSCYDEGKRVAESLFMTYHRNYGVDIRMARIFNTYGPRMDKNDGRVVSNFIVKALAGEALPIYGDGNQTRSFCFVDDLIEGFLGLMGSPFAGPVNLGNPEEFTIKDLASLVLEKTASKAGIALLALPQDDPSRRRPDISKAATLWGFCPKTRLSQGVDRTIAYFKE